MASAAKVSAEKSVAAIPSNVEIKPLLRVLNDDIHLLGLIDLIKDNWSKTKLPKLTEKSKVVMLDKKVFFILNPKKTENSNNKGWADQEPKDTDDIVSEQIFLHQNNARDLSKWILLTVNKVVKFQETRQENTRITITTTSWEYFISGKKLDHTQIKFESVAKDRVEGKENEDAVDAPGGASATTSSADGTSLI